jgi:formate dehydrogenase subunit gamma
MRFRFGVVGLALMLAALVGAPAWSQQSRDPAAQAGSAPNPTAQSVNEQQLLQQLRKIEGRITILDPKAGTLEQPQGRDYQTFHERVLPWLGGGAIVAMTLALAVFYLVRGRIRLDAPPTGTKIKRFTWIERFAHWLTAVSFIVLAITGLNYVFGKRLLFPLIGPDAFAAWSQWAKFAHNAFSWPFMFGVALMLVLWIKDNIPDRYDVVWLKQFGGFLSRAHPPARRFNAGQKVIFWSVAVGGLVLTGSGIILLFPFSAADINGMQTAQYLHAIAGVLMTAIIIAHIYIGTLGMEGALDAMVSGEVDLAWAKAHHSVWVEEERARPPDGPQLDKGAVPAE